MTFSLEPVDQKFVDEARPLLVKHWVEIAHYKDIALDPDYEMYFKLQQVGILKCYTNRDIDGKLIGYAIYIVKPALHYKQCLTAMEDIIYIDPERRGFGRIFINWCDEQLKLLGVNLVVHHIKFSHDWSSMLLRMGYEKTDMMLSKRIDR